MLVSVGRKTWENNMISCRFPFSLLGLTLSRKFMGSLKPATHLAILYADRGDRRKSPGVPGAAIAIFADRRDRRVKSPISGMSDISD